LLAFLTPLAVFLVSLAIVISAAVWFTRRLETLCDLLDLSPGVLSVLGALGANVPNYVASIDAIAHNSTDVGLGIIIGSNIYNVAIILGIAALAASGRAGVRLRRAEIQDARNVAYYTIMVLLSTTLLVWLLPVVPTSQANAPSLAGMTLRVAISLLTLGLFAALILRIARRSHVPHTPDHVSDDAQGVQHDGEVSLDVDLPRPFAPDGARTGQAHAPAFSVEKRVSISFVRLGGEIALALALALGGVLAMVQSGQTLTTDLRIPGVLAGLLVLAVATSMPNTVVAVILASTGRAAASVEEIFSSNSINAALGIALPLLFWRVAPIDQLLIMLDTPMMLALTLGALLCVLRGRVSRAVGVLFLLSYAGWVSIHLFW
jgi:cation:H+ antiporter